MSDRPRFNQVNLITRDIERSIEFYRLAGLDIEVGREWPAGSGCRHAEAGVEATLEWDNEQFLRIWAPEAKDRTIGAVIGLSLESSDAVDETFAKLIAAGHAPIQSPYDAFWGARYAIVEDPDGNAVGLMGPKAVERRYIPEM